MSMIGEATYTKAAILSSIFLDENKNEKRPGVAFFRFL